jgi:hypothetical protein
MIRVHPAPEPADFDEKVRQPGLSAMAELVGEEPLRKRPGPRRKKLAERREDIPSEAFPPYWTHALDNLLDAYQRICAYVCIHIEKVTGAASVDHLIPKSRAWDHVYEWSNYRIACSLMNTRKGVTSEVLDPFEVQDGWLALELVGFQVVLGESLDASIRERVVATIETLNLNDRECCGLREEYASEYQAGHISLDYLRRRAPFVARELQRQGRLNERDR